MANFIVVDPGYASHSCGCPHCEQCAATGEAKVQDQEGKMWYYPFMDEDGSSPYTTGEIIFLDEEDMESLRPVE